MQKKDMNPLPYFKEVMSRYGATEFQQTNGIMYSKCPKYSILVIPEHDLWLQIIEDEDLKTHIREVDITTKEGTDIQKLTLYAKDLDSDLWIGLNNDDLYAGKICEIPILDFDYVIPVSKGLWPKLKKSEYNCFSYRVYENPLMLVLKKTFKALGSSFSVLRLFYIL